jgi:addiction module HigA family antidote
MSAEELIPVEHPGIMLKEDFLDGLGIKPGTMAAKIGVDRTAIKNIIEGKRGITAEMALRFGLYFGTSAEFWLNLQKDYELRMARRQRMQEFEKTVQPCSKIEGSPAQSNCNA